MRKNISVILAMVVPLLLLGSSCVCDGTADFTPTAELLSAHFRNETDKDAIVVYRIYDGYYTQGEKMYVPIEAGQENIVRLWQYPKGFEDTKSEGYASIDISLFREKYTACGWSKGMEGFPEDSEYNQYGLCYVEHPITKDSICYAEVNGTVTPYEVNPVTENGVSYDAVIKANDDGSQYITWSLRYPKTTE